MSNVQPLYIDLSSCTEVEIKAGMNFVRVTPDRLLECLSWLFCDVDTDVSINKEGIKVDE